MIRNGTGGSNTKTGIQFEERADLKNLLEKNSNYKLVKTENNSGYKIFYKDQEVARCFKKNEFYILLLEYKINYTKYLSKKLLPDNGIFVIIRDTLFIIEVKFQQTAGSVDEKLQTCDFKRKQYTKLVHSLGWKVEYVYILNDWFKDKRYKDVLDYIHSVNCHYMFNEIPLKWFGLPV